MDKTCLKDLNILPLTNNSAECIAIPASFVATQVKFPMCDWSTNSMVNNEVFLPTGVMLIDISVGIGLSLNNHENRTGMSPLLTRHDTWTVSPMLGSSSNENGVMWGDTTDKKNGIKVCKRK